MPRVQLIGKPDCHLCDEAEKTVAAICSEFNIEWERISIFDNPALADQYAEFIPVVLIDGLVHDQFRVSQARFRKALQDIS